MKKRIFAWTVEAVLASGIIVGAVAVAQGHRENTAEIESMGKQWLVLMNKDNDNTVDRKEFLDYMSAQFTKADRDHDGTLDARELGQLRMELSYQH
jgi:Ca2+-binding EF-hand superfamily protein